MKNVICALALILFATTLFAQRKAPTPEKQAEYNRLISKSNGARTGGIIMASTGGAMLAGGVVTMIVGLVGDYNDYTGEYDVKNGTVLAGAIIGAVGIGVGVSSIAFFRKSHKLRKEAKLQLRSTSIMMPTQNTTYTAVRMKGIPQMQLSFTVPF